MKRIPKIQLLLLTLVLTSSCSLMKNLRQSSPENASENLTDDYQPSVAEQAEYYRVQEQLIERDLPNCNGCIHGSAHEETFTPETQVFEISAKAAQELNLKNTKFDIPVTWNRKTKMWVKFFTGRGRKHFINYTNRAGRYAPVLSKMLADNGLPRDLIFLAMAESGFQNHARSWAKAVGPWQFMPATGKKFGLNIDWYIDERRDPLKATVAAANYLKLLYGYFGHWELAAAGYNAGEGKVRRAIRRYKTKDFWRISRGRYLRPETKNYVPKIMALAIIGKNLDVFGFNDIEFEKALDYEEILVKGNSDLYALSEVLDLDFEEIKRYNPELVRWQVPPYLETYPLRVPVGVKDSWEKFENKDSVLANSYKTYTVKHSATFRVLSRKFRVPSKVIKDLNPNIAHQRKLKAKTKVLLPFHEDHSLKNRLYSDIYERSTKRKRRRRSHRRMLARYAKKGKMIKNPSVFYTVKKGDTLWSVAKNTGVPMSTLIRTNHHIIKKRRIYPGDKLAIR